MHVQQKINVAFNGRAQAEYKPEKEVRRPQHETGYRLSAGTNLSQIGI